MSVIGKFSPARRRLTSVTAVLALSALTAPLGLGSRRAAGRGRLLRVASRIGLVAIAKVPDPKGNPRYVMDAMQGQITMSIEGALMKLSHTADEITVRCGHAFEVPLKLARSPKLTGPVSVELLVAEELTGLVSAAPLEWPGDKETAKLRIVSKDDPRLVGTWKLTARATGAREGHPVVSETEFEIEFTRPIPKPISGGK